ncbi:g6650 [Coccomyxa viridis]|uniref:G6650 protein n=1 Tax=Coccomyxa viridis TaxID=1274662 RepID=A0ABP1FVV4_9CHLO
MTCHGNLQLRLFVVGLFISILCIYESAVGSIEPATTKHHAWRKGQHGSSGTRNHLQLSKPRVQSSVTHQSTPSDMDSFKRIFIWAWIGVYHQSKELERALGSKYAVSLYTFQHLPDPDPADDDALYIIMPAFSASSFPPHYILYQTEQWGHQTLDPHNAVWPNKRGNQTRQFTLDAFEGALEVWDYSQQHLLEYAASVEYQSRSIKFRHVPFAFFRVEPSIEQAKKDINVLHYGLVQDGNRRKVILNQLEEKGIDIHIAPYSVWGEELSKLLRRAKIVLNLHYHDAKILETCRVLESLSYGALVISEPGVEVEIQRQWEGKLIFAKGAVSIAKAIEHYIGNEEARLARQQLSWDFAHKTHSLEPFLWDLL